MAKLSPYCCTCGRALTEDEMQSFLAFCERNGHEPLVIGADGIHCWNCVLQLASEAVAHGEKPELLGTLRKVYARAVVGLRVVK